jgi:hypothetical protein
LSTRLHSWSSNIWVCVWDDLGLNLSQDNDYPDKFSVIFLSLQENSQLSHFHLSSYSWMLVLFECLNCCKRIHSMSYPRRL